MARFLYGGLHGISFVSSGAGILSRPPASPAHSEQTF